MATQQSVAAAIAGDSPPPPRRARESHARSWNGLGVGFLAKLGLMAVINALGLAAVWSAFVNGAWVLLGAMVVLLVLADWIYFTRRHVPLKYLFPGLAFLAVFQLFTIGYTGYVALTNYGTGHNVSQEQAVDALLSQNEKKVPDSPSFPLTIVRQGDALGFAVVQGGAAKVGAADQPLELAADATVVDSVVTAVPGWEVVPKSQVLADAVRADEVLALGSRSRTTRRTARSGRATRRSARCTARS